jgi:hypothetical protein
MSSSSSKKKKKPFSSSITIRTRLSTHDVLFGRGQGVAQHPGNVLFRQLVDQHRPAYAAAEKVDKGGISRKIVDAITTRGGTFVRALVAAAAANDKTKKYYQVVDLPRAHEKTSQALRERVMRKSRGTKNLREGIPLTKSSLTVKHSSTTTSAKKKTEKTIKIKTTKRVNPKRSSSSHRAAAQPRTPTQDLLHVSELLVNLSKTRVTRSRTTTPNNNKSAIHEPPVRHIKQLRKLQQRHQDGEDAATISDDDDEASSWSHSSSEELSNLHKRSTSTTNSNKKKNPLTTTGSASLLMKTMTTTPAGTTGTTIQSTPGPTTDGAITCTKQQQSFLFVTPHRPSTSAQSPHRPSTPAPFAMMEEDGVDDDGRSYSSSIDMSCFFCSGEAERTCVCHRHSQQTNHHPHPHPHDHPDDWSPSGVMIGRDIMIPTSPVTPAAVRGWVQGMSLATPPMIIVTPAPPRRVSDVTVHHMGQPLLQPTPPAASKKDDPWEQMTLFGEDTFGGVIW